MVKHNLDRTEFEAKKVAKDELKKPHTPANSVPGIRARVDLIEQVLGIVVEE